MKKFILLFIICFLVSPLCLFAEEEEPDTTEEETEITEEDLAITPEKKGFLPVKDRRFEIGLAHTRFGFANNFLSTSEVFKDSVVIDLDDLKNGFKVNLDIGLTPLFFNYFSPDRQWGFGLALDVDTVGMLNLSGNMLTLSNAKNEKSEIGGAVFVDFKGTSFFHVKKLNTKFKANLSIFYPMFYVDPDISYSKNNSGDSTKIDIDYKVRVYSLMSMEDGASSALTSSPGIDIQLGAEYPLAQVLGLKEKFSFLDFIVGLDFINIPIVPGTMSNYMEMKGNIGGGKEINIDDTEDLIDVDGDEKYGNSKKRILRPFKMLTWADWKPFDTVPVSFIPTIGFAINPMYREPGSLEAGIKARYDLANLFITTIGMGYHDRMWKNSIDFIFNLRYFELNFGLDLRSQDFVKSWSGSGFGVNFGLKFGA